jgi:hypothetical protein
MNATTVLSKSGLTALDDVRTEKLHAWHRERLAVVYVRQSSPQQVLDHQESTRLQYGLVSRAQALGWAADRILVIDDESSQVSDQRPGAGGLPTLGLGGELGSCRDDLRGGNVALGALQQGLASALGAVRTLPHSDC